MDFEQKQNYTMQDLLHVITLLRSPEGCPWDREQTHESIRTNLIEETYEVADAIDQKDTALLQEELGDLLMQILLHTEMEREKGTFNFDDVCDTLCKKMVYRHPHVFGDVKADSTGQVLHNWEALKNAEKGRSTAADRLDSVPAALPALMRSEKTQKRAAAYGFAYKDVGGAMQDLNGEVAELQQAVETGEGLQHEVGDVLFSAVNVARMLDVDAEEALARSCERFAGRVKTAEQLAEADGKHLEDVDPKELDGLWTRAKKQEKNDE